MVLKPGWASIPTSFFFLLPGYCCVFLGVCYQNSFMTNLTDPSINFNNPLYLHPSDTPGVLLVSHKLHGIENYSVWSRSMRIALLAKNKLGFVEGTCSKESLPGCFIFNGNVVTLSFYLGFWTQWVKNFQVT